MIKPLIKWCPIQGAWRTRLGMFLIWAVEILEGLVGICSLGYIQIENIKCTLLFDADWFDHWCEKDHNYRAK